MKKKILFNISNIALVLAFLLCNNFAFSMHQKENEIEIRKINSINDVLNIVEEIRQEHPTDSIVTACDWDETISYRDGQELHFRENKTRKVFEKLVEDFEVKPFILTARYSGLDLDELNEYGFDSK